MDAASRRINAAVRARVLTERLVARLAQALRRYFGGQAARAVALYLVGAPDLIPDEETVKLATLLERHARVVVGLADASAAQLLGLDPDPDDFYRLALILQRTGDRVRMITEETRRVVRETIAEGIARGYHPRVIARGKPSEDFRGIRDVVRETYRRRAETIARTETALVWQETAHDRYQRAGVTHVRIHDGAGCGWTSHDDPDKANGSVRTLEDARAHPIAHPNCRRASAPIVEGRR